MKILNKDPDAIIDYVFDWTEWLNGDVISTSTFILSGCTNVLDTKTDNTTTIWLSGGTNNLTHSITNRISTIGGRTEDRTLLLNILEK